MLDVKELQDFPLSKDAEKAHLMLIWLLASQNDNRLPLILLGYVFCS